MNMFLVLAANNQLITLLSLLQDKLLILVLLKGGPD